MIYAALVSMEDELMGEKSCAYLVVKEPLRAVQVRRFLREQGSEVILPLLDESDEPFDDDNLIDYGLDSVRMMALAARWRKVHGDIDFVMLAKNPTIDAWWKLLSREVK